LIAALVPSWVNEGDVVASDNTTIWGIHAGRYGEADSLFLKKGYIALGWEKMPDLSTIVPTRDACKATLLEVEPDYKPGAVPGAGGQLYRFAHEMQVDDLVIYRSKISRDYHLGRISGEYEYRPDVQAASPHVRRVKWLKKVEPTQMSQGALFEMGAAQSLFQVRNYAESWLKVLNNGAPGPNGDEEGDDDDTIGVVATAIEQSTRVYILKQFQAELKGHPFADYVAHLLNAMGYNTRVSPPGTDSGVDIIAHRDQLGFEPPIIKVQVKSGDGNVGQPEVSQLLGQLGAPGEHGLFVTLSDYTNPASNLAKTKSNLRLLTGDDVIDLTLQHYEQLDSHYRAIIPLKRVYVPEPVED
jgi:restriction system protein